MFTKEEERRKKRNHRTEGDTDHRLPLEEKEGDAPLGYSG
jgi:hypothetical protein